MNTDNKDLGDQMAQDKGFSEESGETEDLLLVDDEDDDVIELTDVAEDFSDGNYGLAGDETESISLDAEALEEEEIIELVDAVEDEEDGEEEVLDLTDVVETEVSASEEAPSDIDLTDDLSDDNGLVEDVGIVLEEEAIEMPAVEDSVEVPELSVDMDDIAIEGEDAEDGNDDEPLGLVPDADASMPFEATPEPAGSVQVPLQDQAKDQVQEQVIHEGLSDEKIEAVITKVVKEAIDEKADRILLEVAEAAIAREIDKIKKAL